MGMQAAGEKLVFEILRRANKPWQKSARKFPVAKGGKCPEAAVGLEAPCRFWPSTPGGRGHTHCSPSKGEAAWVVNEVLSVLLTSDAGNECRSSRMLQACKRPQKTGAAAHPNKFCTPPRVNS